MNFNANNTGSRQPIGRKPKRVSDVNAMGSSYNSYAQQQQSPYPGEGDMTASANSYDRDLQSSNFEQPTVAAANSRAYGFDPRYSNLSPSPGLSHQPAPGMAAQPTHHVGNVFGQPMVQDMAFQYGQQLASTGTAVVKQEIEKIVPVSRLKYYFAVDTKYVISKLRLIFFPFTHSDWSIRYEQDGPIQPRFEINAPDLYIPTMAYVTYVLVAGLVLGTQQRFSPEQIGILASSALAWCIVELAVYSATLYIANIQTSLRTFDLLAYGGYKFVGVIVSILLSLVGGRTAYYVGLVYASLALAFYLVRTLRVQILQEANQQNSYYGDVPMSGHKRRLYFLLFIAAVQPLLSWWLSFHLIGSTPVLPASTGTM